MSADRYPTQDEIARVLKIAMKCTPGGQWADSRHTIRGLCLLAQAQGKALEWRRVMAKSKTFVFTEQHRALLRRMIVGWQDCEYGAPEIDPKRPYGNSSVEQDIAEILGMELCGDDDGGPCLSKHQRERCKSLHAETLIAVQIVLAHGVVLEGRYELNDEYKWVVAP